LPFPHSASQRINESALHKKSLQPKAVSVNSLDFLQNALYQKSGFFRLFQGYRQRKTGFIFV